MEDTSCMINNVTFKKILVPLDGSEMSQKAFKYALSVAKSFGTELALLNVIPQHVADAAVYRVGTHRALVKNYIKMMNALARQQATDLLDKKMQECEKENVKTSYRILQGDAVSEIIEASKKLKIDLIVIGSVGLTGIKKLKALGSVSRKVSELSDCPVLIVR